MIRSKLKSLLSALFIAVAVPAAAEEPSYPLIMGVVIADAIKYDDPARTQELAKPDALVLNFWPGWRNERYGDQGIQVMMKKLRAINPKQKIGQYTVVTEAKDSTTKDTTQIDIARKIDAANWWAKGAGGAKVQWTDLFGAWEVNITRFAKPDSDGRRYPQWLAQRNYNKLFKGTDFDFWFMDNSGPQSPVALADWNLDGIPDVSKTPEMAAAWRQGNVDYWNAIKALQPNTMLVANAVDLTSTEYQQKLNGALMEALMGKSWSYYNYQGWPGIFKRYTSFMNNTKAPHLVGFNVWGKVDDYRFMRFALATCLMNDGYFSYTNVLTGYKTVPWFDEFDADLGAPDEAPPTQAWQNGVWRRAYKNGIALVNPTKEAVTVSLGGSYQRLKGQQDPLTNSGETVQSVKLAGEDGIILMRIAPPSPVQNLKVE